MRFWSGTAFMKTSEAVAGARMFDETGYDGIVCSDHLIYPRELSSPYPDSPTGKPLWSPDTLGRIPGCSSVRCRRLRALRLQYGREDKPFEIMLALLEPPSPDLYKRAEDVGITAAMCAPWAGTHTGESRGGGKGGQIDMHGLLAQLDGV